MNETGDTRGAAIRLAGYAFLILFFELALIRYVAGYVRVFGFYVNLVLIATFLGMGAGLLRTEGAAAIRWLAVGVPPLLFTAVAVLSRLAVRGPQDPNEALWNISIGAGGDLPRFPILPALVVLFTLCTLTFVPLGALLGREFKRLPPLHAYSLDVSGSLLGILAFGLLSALRTPPVVWFTTAFLVFVVLSRGPTRFRGALAAAGLACVAMAAKTASSKPEYWSQYYRINVVPGANYRAVTVNGSLHQYILDLDPAVPDTQLQGIRGDYLRPFSLVSRADTVLVVGAGTGNDLAILLQLGVRYIDAVEIDGVILDLGRAGHPQAPYADPRVRAHVDDARAFLRKTRQRYDVIVFGTLDSQTLLHGLSSLRLDNYLYTVEAIRAARDRLKPDGVLIMYHMSPLPYIAAKIYGMLETVFGQPPAVNFDPQHRLFNYTFVAGGADNPGATQQVHAGLREAVPLPTDDWPYLYLRHRTVPGHYLSVLAAALAIAVGLIAWAARGAGSGGDGAMFFLGTGFLLVETRSVTEMSLLFGSTWTVNLLVFSSILLMILGANVVAWMRRNHSVTALFACLFAALALGYLIPVHNLLVLGTTGQWVAGGLKVALPIFFAAVIFATLLREHPRPNRALAYNVLGAVVGGVLEYSAMVIGIRALYLVAAAAYAASLWYVLRRRPGRARVEA